MSRKALKVVVEIKFRAVSCPGVHLMAKEDIYLSVRFMGQFRQSECLPPVFPLLFHEKMTFEKIFRYAVDPGDIAVMLEFETVRIELVQLIPPMGDTLAYYENDARRFLFPEPKLVPPFSGTEQEVLMTRAPYFPGICPRLEFSTTTTIFECQANAEITEYPNVSMRPLMKRQKHSSRAKTSYPQGRSHSLVRRRSARGNRSISRSRSMSPLRVSNSQRLAHLSLDSEDQDPASRPQPMPSSRPGARSASPHQSSTFTSPAVSRSPSTVRFASPERRPSLSNGLVEDSANGDLHFSNLQDSLQSCDLPPLGCSYTEDATPRRSLSNSHRTWEEVHERVRGLLTTPKAVRRLAYGATNSEVDEVLARRSISPGPPL